jgi:uncharacterized protein
MKNKTESCSCSASTVGEKRNRMHLFSPLFYFVPLAVFYMYLDRLVNYFVYTVLGLDKTSRFTEALRFFVFDFPKVLILLTVIVFAVGIIRSFFTPERTRRALEGKSLFAGNVMASLLGIVTPFCSCSAIPLFLGFVEAGVPLGVTFSFLISAPMINEVALVLLFGLFGWRTALLYASTGLVIAIFAGWVIGKLKLERFVEPWVYNVKMGKATEETTLTWSDRITAGYVAVKEIVVKVWIYIAIGIVVGAFIHGYVPENMMASIMGKGSGWWSVPVAVLLGVPMYSNAAGIIPIIQALLEKGASLGTALAFMMAVIGLSLPEMIILRKVLKMQMILIFAGIVAVGIMIVGFIFNMIY